MNPTTAIWEEVRQTLRRLRGQNLLRARQEEIPARDQVVLYDEHRGSGLKESFWVLQIRQELSEMTATHYPDQEVITPGEQDLETFLTALATRVRGKAYLRTRMKGTAYR